MTLGGPLLIFPPKVQMSSLVFALCYRGGFCPIGTALAVTVEFSYVFWCFTSHATVFQSYMLRHRCASGLKKKLYLRSGSQRHKHYAGFFNVPVLHRYGTISQPVLSIRDTFFNSFLNFFLSKFDTAG